MATCPQEGSVNGFVIDENGQYHLAPLKLPELMSAPMSIKKSSEKKCIKRKYIPIKPEKFDFTPFELNNSPGVPKKRKIDKTSVRKELFTASPRKSIRSSLPKQHPKSISIKPVKKTLILRKNREQAIIPMNKIDEETTQSDQSFTLKSPPRKSLSDITNQPITPSLHSDEADESHSEQTFIMNEIKTWIQEEKEDFKIYQKRHQEKLQKLEELLNQFVTAPLRTSSKKVMFSPSPARSKKVDLRKIALNNHLKENIEYQAQSPRTKKAVQMYNSIRCDYNVLCTPKFEKTSVDNPQASVSRSLSRKIQKQCLMLQDTPKQKS